MQHVMAVAHADAPPDWEDVYETHARRLAGYLTRLVHDRETAADLMQETFARAMENHAELREAAALRSWLYTIATRLAVRLRRGALLRFVPLLSAPLIADEFEPDALYVHEALASIPADQAAALLLHHQQGFTRHEIAGVLNLSDEGVKSRLARGRANFIAAYRRLERGLRA
jgi:RNA polymerase sigma-70 factor (ECF subfamily)